MISLKMWGKFWLIEKILIIIRIFKNLGNVENKLIRGSRYFGICNFF